MIAGFRLECYITTMLKITIISVGKKHDLIFHSAITSYEQKLRPHCQVSWVLVPSSDMATESQQIINKTNDTYVVLLDQSGTQFSSEDIADFIDKRQTQAQTNVAIVIGGAYGVSDELKAHANQVISLGKLTFPHQLVRLMLLEQLYRGFSILKNTNYHHG